MKFSLSNFSILKQILIGYTPVIAVLIFLAYSSFQHFDKFEKSFKQLQYVTKENIAFLEIERDIVELQRNVAIYSYVGYNGVIKKINFLQQSLENKFIQIAPIINDDKEIKDRFERMSLHYNSYKQGFQTATKERKFLKNLGDSKLQELFTEEQKTLKEISQILLQQQNFEAAYIISELENSLLQANNNLKTFQSSPDAILLKEARSLISEMLKTSTKLKNKTRDKNLVKKLDNFSNNLKEYKNIFLKMARVNRNYLQLINVVLAGKAAEIDKLSNELDTLVKERSKSLSLQIQDNIHHSQKQFITLALMAIILGLISSTLIALGISNPVFAMATTLSQLATGKSGIDIPGQNRGDEVGKMAKAANEFKIMAKDLKGQTAELEEFSYRTSHDLRSPLMSAIGLLRVAEQSIHNDEKDSAVKTTGMAISSLVKLELLVKDILVLTKTKNEDEDDQKIDVDTVIKDAVEKLSHLENYDRLDFKLNLEFKNYLIAKKMRLVLIIENLISNAVKYQDLNKAQSFIKVSTKKQDGCFVVIVEDNGLGIPDNQQDNLFSMFKRFHPRTSFGSGLGLYMIKKSADILNGEISYQSTDEGSLFKLIMPIK